MYLFFSFISKEAEVHLLMGQVAIEIVNQQKKKNLGPQLGPRYIYRRHAND